MPTTLGFFVLVQSCLSISQGINSGSINKVNIYNNDKRFNHQQWYTMTSNGCLSSGLGRQKRELVSESHYQHRHKWNSTLLTYKIHGNPASLDKNKTRLALYKAFRVWAKQTDFVFYEAENDVDINIRFLSGFHGDGESQAFDGIGGHLAHALYPPEGEIHFDADEWWSLTANRRTAARGFYRNITHHPYNLVHVAAHEIGHALGLPHSRYTKSLMYPLYQNNMHLSRQRVKLHYTDLEELSNIYNNDKQKSISLRNTTPKLQNLFLQMKDNPNRYMSLLPPRYYGQHRIKPSIPDPCDCKIDASFVDRKEIYLFSNRYYWTINTQTHEISQPKKILHTWRLSKPKVDAATHSTFSDRTYLFSGHKYWRLYRGVIEPGFPRYVKDRGLPSSPDSAICIPETPKLLVFKGNKYYVFHELMEKVTLNSPKHIRGLNTDLVPKTESPNGAMFMPPSGILHVIRGEEMIEIYCFDENSRNSDGKCGVEKYAVFGKESPINCVLNNQ